MDGNGHRHRIEELTENLDCRDPRATKFYWRFLPCAGMVPRRSRARHLTEKRPSTLDLLVRVLCCVGR